MRLQTEPTSTAIDSRREFLSSIALAWLTSEGAQADEPTSPHAVGRGANTSLEPRTPHFSPKALRVIYLFMHGGPSHLETFDAKPDLQRLAGRPLPASFGTVATSRNVARNPLLATKRTFTRHGQSGIEVSDLLPYVATCVDDLAVIRSCWADSVEHSQAVYQMNTGSILMGRPCLGSWVGYGLGTENENLPAFVVLPQPDPGVNIKGGAQAYGAGFLPATFQATVVHGGAMAMHYLRRPASISATRQRRTLDLVGKLNGRHQLNRGDPELEARIRAYELAYRMQAAAPEAVELSAESAVTWRLYGLDDPITADFGARCLLARRLIERGVRFVQLFSGDITGWDAHNDIEANHAVMCSCTDKPVAALLRDLKARGLLSSTLVLWGGEFGRLPMSEGGQGRDHNPHGFTVWMAGAGIKGGTVHGATDAVGLRAEVDRVHVRDLHATVLHLLGLDHTLLTFPSNGRDERLTGTAGRVIRPILI